MNDVQSDLYPADPPAALKTVQTDLPLQEMDTDDLILHLTKVQSVLCDQVSQSQQHDKMQNLMKAKALFDANIAAINSAPFIESFGFRHLASESSTFSVYIKPVDLVTKYYSRYPERVSYIGKFSIQDRAALLTKYLQNRASRSLGKKCLYEMRRKIACDRPRVGGRFIRQKDKDDEPNMHMESANKPKVPAARHSFSTSQAMSQPLVMFTGTPESQIVRQGVEPIPSLMDSKQSGLYRSISPRYPHSNQSMPPQGLSSPANMYVSPFGYNHGGPWSMGIPPINTFTLSTSPRDSSLLHSFFTGAPESGLLPGLPGLPGPADPHNYWFSGQRGPMGPGYQPVYPPNFVPMQQAYVYEPFYAHGCPQANAPSYLPTKSTQQNYNTCDTGNGSGNGTQMSAVNSLNHTNPTSHVNPIPPAEQPYPAHSPNQTEHHEQTTISQTSRNKMEEYASCIQMDHSSGLTSGNTQVTDSDFIPVASSIANQGLFTESTLSGNVFDNDDEGFLTHLGKRTEMPASTVPNVQTISELTSSFSTQSSDLGYKRQSKKALDNHEAVKPDSELSDVSFTSGFFADI